MKKNNNIVSLAVSKEQTVIRKTFTEDELIALKEDYTQDSIAHSRLEAELKEAKLEFKQKMDPIKQRSKSTLNAIVKGFEDIHMEVLLVPNEEKRTMEQYSEETGEMVGSRPMTLDEKRYYSQLDSLPTSKEETAKA